MAIARTLLPATDSSVDPGADVAWNRAADTDLNFADFYAGNHIVMEHCRACARAIIAALEDIKFTRPDEIQGLF